MRRTLIGVLASTLAAQACACSFGGDSRVKSEELTREAVVDAPAAVALRGDLVVHEWGTLTGFEGQDGLDVDGLQHEAEALPAFVHASTLPPTESPYRLYGDRSLDVPVRRVNSKMETPVLYFYSAVPQTVNVRVDFDGGLLSEWYPAAAASPAPASASGAEADKLDVAGVHRSSLAWRVELTPFDRLAPTPLPVVAETEPWAFARDVRAAFVTTQPDGDAPRETERYVFYRGLGRLSLPVQVIPFCGGMAALVNREEAPIDDAFLIEMNEREGRFTRMGAELGDHASRVLRPSAPLRAKGDVVRDLASQMTDALVARGLFEDEARAMVRTWSPTWFSTEGTRLLYLLPRARIDALLPLKIEPIPRETQRVLVARQEFLAPERATDIERALRERMQPDLRDDAMRRLARLGRFLEPAVRSVGSQSTDAQVRASATEVLAAFH